MIQTLRRIIRSPRFWLICATTSAAWVLFEFDLFIPMYMQESVGLDPVVATFVAAAHPLGMFVAMTAGGILIDRVGREAGGWLMVGSLGGVAGVVAAFWALTATGGVTLPLGIVLTAAHGVFMGMPAYMPQSLFALRFGGKHECATLLAVIDTIAFSAVIVFDVTSDRITDSGVRKLFLLPPPTTDVNLCDGVAEKLDATLRGHGRSCPVWDCRTVVLHPSRMWRESRCHNNNSVSQT
jgi:MFS family permease